MSASYKVGDSVSFYPYWSSPPLYAAEILAVHGDGTADVRVYESGTRNFKDYSHVPDGHRGSGPYFLASGGGDGNVDTRY